MYDLNCQTGAQITLYPAKPQRRGKSGKQITVEAAEKLVEMAEAVRTDFGCT